MRQLQSLSQSKNRILVIEFVRVAWEQLQLVLLVIPQVDILFGRTILAPINAGMDSSLAWKLRDAILVTMVVVLVLDQVIINV